MNDNGRDELEQLARFCLVLRIPYSEAQNMTQDEIAAFSAAHEKLEKERAKAYK